MASNPPIRRFTPRVWAFLSLLALLYGTLPVYADVPEADQPPREPTPGVEPDHLTLETTAKALTWQWNGDEASDGSLKPVPTPGTAVSRIDAQDMAAHVWLMGDHLSAAADQLIEQAGLSWRHGLDPETYHYSALKQIQQDLRNRSRVLDVRLGASIRRMADDGFVKLSDHLAHGLVDGRRVQERMFHTALPVDAEQLLKDIHDGRSNVRDTIRRLPPQHEQYLRLSDLLTALLGERNWLLERLRDESHGATRRTLNQRKRELDRDINRVAMSLERWRWMPRELGARHALVNLPEFMLYLRDEHQTILEMPVVIGAKKHKTPTFSRDIRYIEVAPTWTVPASITREELFPKFSKDPAWITRNNYDVLEYADGGFTTVDPTTLDFSEWKASNFPYTLRQRPGPWNALGRLKVMFPNPYAIYMHDTPAKRLFSQEVRAYSHGCVRLSDPFKLVRALLRIDGWRDSSVQRFLGEKNTTARNLRDPIPAHLVYLTSWVDDTGELKVFNDIYGYDPALEDRLLVTHGSLIGTLIPEAATLPLIAEASASREASFGPD